jgi:hypothetical protein
MLNIFQNLQVCSSSRHTNDFKNGSYYSQASIFYVRILFLFYFYNIDNITKKFKKSQNKKRTKKTFIYIIC